MDAPGTPPETGEGLRGQARAHFQLETPDSVAGRILAGAEECVCRWGWSKTTIEDIAREAGLSRATIYRAFPGGRDVVFEALRRRKVIEFFGELEAVASAAPDVESLLTDVIHTAAVSLAADEQFQYQLRHEPGEILQALTFRGLDRLIVSARVFLAPHLARFVSRRDANRLAEWATRVTRSYLLEPSPHLVLEDRDSVRAFVASRITAGSSTSAGPQAPSPPSATDPTTDRAGAPTTDLIRQ